MNKLLLLLAVLVYGCGATHKEPHTGLYRIKYASYGMFGTSIELKADSTFTKNFRGDMMNDYSYGRWQVSRDTLMLTFDTITYPASRYRKQEKYMIKGKKLVQADELVKILKQNGFWDTLSPRDKRRLRKIQNQTMIDFKGTMRTNYYRLVK